MPTYDYACDGCGHQFEHFQSMTAEPLKTCPKCAKKALKRLIGTGAGVIFKGAGFYTTDYRSESYKKAAESDKSNGKPDAAKADAAKPESGAATAATPAASAETPADASKAALPSAPKAPASADAPKPRKKSG